jgi:hypothetical protein
MSNEREAYQSWLAMVGNPPRIDPLAAFQAGAEWQRSQSAPAGLVLPERMKESIYSNLEWLDGWNSCLDEVAHLNRSKT